MFSSIDKAVVALLMAGVFLLNNLVGWDLGLGEDTLNAVAAVLSPLLVWLVPNRRPA